MSIRYAHTNLIAHDWRRLARFYQDVFGCEPIPPERDMKGDWLDRVTAVKDAHIRGIHLRLPGHGDTGPTLEIFQYEPNLDRPNNTTHTPGFMHIAFAVDDVADMARKVQKAGGSEVGELMRVEIAGAGWITLQYLADPEGNIVEIQKWEATPISEPPA